MSARSLRDRRTGALIACFMCAVLCVSARAGSLSGQVYVALGSSYAAAPGVGTSADDPPNRCGRSRSNYAHQTAQRLNLKLIDVTCSGATTAELVNPWRELPAQVTAVTPETRLVTVTIGGNDLHYAANLSAVSCKAIAASKAPGAASQCPQVTGPSEADYRSLDLGLGRIVDAIRQRASKARIIFVEYPSVLPDRGLCEITPMGEGDAHLLRQTEAGLAAATEKAAAGKGVEILRFAAMSRGHDACSSMPWVTGYFDPSGKPLVPYHPNLAGMTAIADALVDKLQP